MLTTTKRFALAASAIAIAGAAAPAAHAETGPIQQSFPGGLTTSLIRGGALDPAGANDWNCKPSATKPRPVILVHGTWENKYSNWAYMAPALKSRGLCIFALNYSATGVIPLYGTGSIRASANELSSFVDRVLGATGASEVDLVGHSQGGMMPRAYLKYIPGSAAKVKNLVTLGATHKGTTLSGLGSLGNTLGVMAGVTLILGQAATDQVIGSPFITALNQGGLTVRGVDYTTIVTKFDEITTPWQNGQIKSADNPAGAYVKNIVLQDGCATNFSDHLSMSYSKRSRYFVEKALGAISSNTPICDVQLPLV